MMKSFFKICLLSERNCQDSICLQILFGSLMYFEMCFPRIQSWSKGKVCTGCHKKMY